MSAADAACASVTKPVVAIASPDASTAIFCLVFGFVIGVLDRFGAAAEEEHPE